MRSDSLFFILFLVLLLGVFHNLAFTHFLYWKYWWYDVMMHFLGGAIVSATLAWGIVYEFPEKWREHFFSFVYVGLFVLLVGIVWEIFEYVVKTDRYITPTAWGIDTGLDLVLDVLGGVCAYFVFRSAYIKYGK